MRDISGFDPIADAAYFLRQRHRLLRDYAGRFIAIRNGAVIAEAEDYFTLYWRLCDIW